MNNDANNPVLKATGSAQITGIAAESDSRSYGITGAMCEITVSDNAVITGTGGKSTSSDSYGIYDTAANGVNVSVNVSENAQLIGTSAQAGRHSMGVAVVMANAAISVSENALLKGTGDTAGSESGYSMGLAAIANGSVTVSGYAKLTASAKTGNFACAVYAGEKIVVSGGTVEAASSM